MSLISFDTFNLYERPIIILCRPDLVQQYVLGDVVNLVYSPRFNAVSELSFTAFEYINGTKMPYYDYLVNRKVIYVEEFGYFQIIENQEHGDGVKTYKDIVCQSIEVRLMTKALGVFKGTYKFYDVTSPSGTLLQTILDYLPDWSVGTVDASIAIKYRTFDITDSTIYSFLMNDVEEAYECVFTFDTINKTISAYSVSNATTDTDIYISYDNLINSIELDEIYDEMVTSLTVSGAGDLSINQVNPLGSDTIYNFTHYKDTEWMSQELIDAITAWESLVASNQSSYADTLTSLLDNNDILIDLESDLVTLEGELSALENVKIVKIQQGLDLSSINADIASKEAEISNKNAEISGAETSRSTLTAHLASINTALSFSSNFTASQIEELQPYIVQSSYTNENFIQTSTMTNSEIQEESQELYNQAVSVLSRISEPRYNFEIDSISFPLIKDFSIFTNQLVLGAVINLEIKPGVVSYPVLLGFDLDYDNPESFKLIFGNRLRLDDSAFQYSDLMNNAISSATTTNVNSPNWSSSASYVNNTVNTFINSALDVAVNNIISGSGQNILIDQSGIRIRESTGTNTFGPNQIWMNNGVIAFSDDSFNTAKLALGEIALPGGGAGYGIVGDYLIGRVLASNSLTITNDSSTFTVDGSGATLTDATLSVQNSTNKIFLDPINGIKIQSTVGGVTTDRFYADTSGNLHISGILDAATGTFSGALSAATINGGTITGATINGGSINGVTGTFSGNIYAANLRGKVQDSQIASLSADKITVGTLSGDRINGGTIYGATISWGNGYIGNYGTGAPLIRGYTNMGIECDGHLGISGNGVTVYSNGRLELEGSPVSINYATVATQPWADGRFAYKWTGRTTSIRVYDYNSSSQRTLRFNNGILTSG